MLALHDCYRLRYFQVMLFGWLADRLSRKMMLIVVVSLFGATSLATTQATDGPTLFACRFLTGLALGGVYPIASALVIGSVSKANRTTLVTIMSVGSAAGAGACGLIAAELTPLLGWRAMFFIGGALPLLLLPLLYWGIYEPERDPLKKRQREWVAGGSFAALLMQGAWRTTLPLWGAFLFCSIPVFFIVGWLPTMAADSGSGAKQAALGASLFAFAGAVGGIAGGKTVDVGGRRAVSLIAVASSIACLLLAVTVASPLFILSCAIAGMLMIGLLNTLAAIAGQLYPDAFRSFGIGCALAVMRVGAAIAPWLGGVALDQEFSASGLIMLAALSLLLTAILTTGLRCSTRLLERSE